MLKSRPMHVNPAAPPHSSFVSPLLFGRSTQLDTLRSALERTRGGLGGTLLVTGDAGVGKSRLIATARAEALENGFQVLEAGCFEPDASVPYAPLLELLAPTAVDMATAAAELAGFVADPNGEPEQERHRLFVALTQYFAGLSDAQPLLLIVEDIHWCDETSLQFLRYLARHIAARRIGLLLSYRVDADKTAPSLDHAVAELERARLAIEVRVNPLSRADVELMAGAILSPRTSLRAEFVDAVFGLTEGNPFFTEEILAVLAETGRPLSQVVLDQRTIDALRIPRSVHDAVVRRLARVSPTAQRVARLGAVAGREFDFALLQSLTQLDEADLLRIVDELDRRAPARRGVGRTARVPACPDAPGHLRPAPGPRTSGPPRQRCSRPWSELFGASTATGHLADLAYHAYAARDWPRVRDYSARMGDRAQRMYAPALAVEHFGRALEAARALGEPSSGQLHRARAQAYEVRGEFEPAEADYRAALEAARADGDRGAEWQGLLDLGFAGSHVTTPGRAPSSSKRLPWRRSWAMPARSRTASTAWETGTSISTSRAAGSSFTNAHWPRFRELGDPVGVAQTLDFVGVAALISGQRRQAIETLEQASAAYRQVNDRRGLASVLATRAHLRCASHVYDMLAGAAPASEQALSEVAEALAIARAIGSRSAEAYAASELAACLTV